MKFLMSLVAASLLVACGGVAPGNARTELNSNGTQRASLSAQAKVAICHETESAKNPFVVISISQSAVPAHIPHHDGDHFYNDGKCCNAQAQYCSTDGDCCSGLSCLAGACAPVEIIVD
jgi:hypothetical protein